MDFLSYEKRLNYVLELIEKGRFGSMEAAARRFDCSSRTVKRMINILREKGHDIRYDRRKKKYFIEKDE
ncbi:HTH domain-containing protein [Mucilaginibacter terrae]|uniref:HTH domain-containing protein n=1 Tax=Mucilaginibacter terrae TaxID=1955052 RepID=UPI0035D6F353